MAIKRYWRLVGVSTPAGGDLELSEIRLYESGALADASATLTATMAPASGALADLRDGIATGVVSWSYASYSQPGFALVWDFGTGGGVTAPTLAIGSGASKNTWLIAATIQFSNDGTVWETFLGSVYGITYPGANSITAPVTAAPIVSGAVSYWPLDESSGSTAVDLIGPNSGTVTGATAVAGKVGRARSFSGASQKANVPIVGFPTTAITICFWAQPNAASNTSVLLTTPEVATDKLNIHFPWVNGNIYWDFGDTSSGGRVSVTFDATWYGQMAFWEFSAIAGVGMKIYRNRVLLASTSTSASFSPTGKTLDIGYLAANNAYWNGVLDELIVFDRALTSAESDTIYNSGAGLALVTNAVLNVSPTQSAATSSDSIGHMVPALPPPDGAAVPHMREHTFFDAYNGGVGNITGTIKEKNTPANTPLRRRVMLIDEASRMTIRETWSDPVSGAFEFRGIKQGVKYSTISYDHLHNYRAVIADNQDAV